MISHEGGARSAFRPSDKCFESQNTIRVLRFGTLIGIRMIYMYVSSFILEILFMAHERPRWHAGMGARERRAKLARAGEAGLA